MRSVLSLTRLAVVGCTIEALAGKPQGSLPAVTRKSFRRLTSSLARAVYALETKPLELLLEATCQAGSEAKSGKDPSREASVGSRKERSGAAWPGYRRPLSARRPLAVCFLTGGGRIERSLVLLAVSGE